MTVSELVQYLIRASSSPEDLVLIPGYEGGYDTPSYVDSLQVYHKKVEWYYGEYWDAEDPHLYEDEPMETETAVAIRAPYRAGG